MGINEQQSSSLREETDEQLISLYREGKEQVLDVILEKYKKLVKIEAKKLFIQGGDNDDLIQEGMIGLMKAINEYDFDNSASFNTFAKICVTRQMYTAVKVAARKKHLPLNSYISIDEGSEEEMSALCQVLSNATQDPEKVYLGREYEESFTTKLMGKLSDLEKEVLVLHITGMEYSEIAKEKGRDLKVIDNALQRIKTKAKQVLKESEK